MSREGCRISITGSQAHPVHPDLQPVVDGLCRLCVSDYGRKAVSSLPFRNDIAGIAAEIAKVTELAVLRRKLEAPEAEDIQDVDGLLDRSRAVYALSEEEFGRLAPALASAARLLHRLVTAGLDGYVGLDRAQLDAFDALVGRMKGSLLDTGVVRPDASPLLAGISARLDAARTAITAAVESMLQSHRQYLQDDFFTVRGGRYVLPVKASFKKDVGGIVRDISQTGETLFIEPSRIVSDNDALVFLLRQEEIEKERILAELTGYVREAQPVINAMLAHAGAYDGLLARARLIVEHDYSYPDLTESRSLALRGAVHPAIAGSPDAVRNDFIIDGDKRLLLVTGPNGGGKTVALKTIAAVVRLTQCSIPSPVTPGSRICVFDAIYEDMGDTQDIGRGVSSFTAKMTLWRSILETAGRESLVVVDELGNFTNPSEGAALSCAFAATLMGRGCIVLAGTHIDQVKDYASSHPLAVAASMLWDDRSSRPRFRISYGGAASSHAIDVARQLAFPAEFLELCDSFLRDEHLYLHQVRSRFEEGVKALEDERESLRTERAALERARADADSEARQAGKAWLERHERFRTAYDDLLREFKRRLDTAESDAKALRKAAAAAASRKDVIEHEIAEVERTGAPELEPGCEAFIPRLGMTGTVVSLSGGTVVVACSGRRISLSTGEVVVSSAAPSQDPPRATATRTRAVIDSPPVSVDIRGMRVDEAETVLDKVIDDALFDGRQAVRIIHGTGTGQLRTGVRAWLKRHPAVAAIEDGTHDDGVRTQAITIARVGR